MEQPDEVEALRQLAERLVALPFAFGTGARERPQLIVAIGPIGLHTRTYRLS